MGVRKICTVFFLNAVNYGCLHFQGMLRLSKPTILLFLSWSILVPVRAQQIPNEPVSYRVFNPFVFNPAITGSRDYNSFDLITAFQGESRATLLGVSSRLSRTEPGYFSAPDVVKFRHIALGGYLFREKNEISLNSGAALNFAYHIPLNSRKFSFLSLGASLNSYFSKPAFDVESGDLPNKGPHPDMNLGVYYYGTNLSAGLSGTGLFGNPGDTGRNLAYTIPLSRTYHFVAAYKLLLYKPLEIVFQPGVISSFDSLNFHRAGEQMKAVLRLYMQNFCIGTYFFNENKNSFFFQYRYPGFFIGGFISMPRQSPYYPGDVIFEITAGLNFSRDKARFDGHSHW